MSSLVDLIRNLQDSQPAEINLQLLGDASQVQFKCVYKESNAPNLFLVFPPKQLPLNIDVSKSCFVAVKGEEKTIAFKAEIKNVNGDRVLELTAQKSIDPTSLRTFYRTDLRTPISVSYTPDPDEKAEAWSFIGETLDLSGGGVLTLFTNEFPNRQRIAIHIRLPHTNNEINCLARVVRMIRLRKERWQIALQFENLSQKEKDTIVASCLSEQRRQLRDNVRTI
jgi:hypothetical protein